MDFEEYQKKSRKTALYPRKEEELKKIFGSVGNLVYPTLGLLGESGEVAEKVKKLIRDKNGVIDEEFRESIKKELGDVLWYLSQLSTELGISLEDVAKTNLDKLFSRLKRNKIHGSGDER